MSMMPLVFWTLLLVPGFAIARRWLSDELEGGMLPGLAVSWLTSCVVLAPFIIICYLVHMPIWLASGVVAAFIAWGIADCIRTKAYSGLGRLLFLSIGLELLIVGIDVYLSAKHGSILSADARVHMARIRFLYENGISNLDPFISTAYPYPIYHTNLHHALFAIGSRLTGMDPLGFWFGSLPAVKLMIASGMGYLAWVIFGGRWAAWVAAVMVVVARGPITFSVYPNQVAPWFLVPMFFGIIARMLAEAWSAKPQRVVMTMIKVGGIALVIGMVHPLYAGFILVIGSPLLVGTALWRWFRGRVSGRTAFLAWLVICICALPFPIVGKMMTVPKKPQYDNAAYEVPDIPIAGQETSGVNVDPEQAVAEIPGVVDSVAEGAETKYWYPLLIKKYPRYSLHVWNGRTWISQTIGRDFTGAYKKNGVPAWRLLVVIAAFIAGLFYLRRREIWYLVMPILIIQAIMIIPPLCTYALIFLGAEWMLSRFSTIAFVLFIPASVPVLAAVVERMLRQPGTWRFLNHIPYLASVVRFSARYKILLALISLFSILVALNHSSHRAPYDWSFYWSRVSRSWNANQGREYRPLLKLQKLYRNSIPAGSVVLTDEFTGTRLAMLHDVSLVASERSSTGVKDGGRRRLDVKSMMKLDTGEEERKALFNKYDVDHYVVRGNPREWISWWGSDVQRGRGYRVFSLLDEPELTSLSRKAFKQGTRLLRKGDLNGAVVKLEKVVLDFPRLEKAWFQLGNALLGKGDVIQAINAFGKAKKLDPLDPRYSFMLGNALFDAEDYQPALDAFDQSLRKAIEEDDLPFAASAMLNMGNTYFMMDYLDDALGAYDRAIELDPMFEKAKNYREQLLSEINYRKSQSVIDAGLPAEPEANTPSASPTP